VFVRLAVPVISKEEEAQIVFDYGAKAHVSRLSEVVARRRVFNQRAVYVIAAMLSRAQTFQDHTQLVMKCSFERVAVV
jgi:hypothetical protein